MSDVAASLCAAGSQLAEWLPVARLMRDRSFGSLQPLVDTISTRRKARNDRTDFVCDKLGSPLDILTVMVLFSIPDEYMLSFVRCQ
jgi:hypothetical protein